MMNGVSPLVASNAPGAIGAPADGQADATATTAQEFAAILSGLLGTAAPVRQAPPPGGPNLAQATPAATDEDAAAPADGAAIPPTELEGSDTQPDTESLTADSPAPGTGARAAVAGTIAAASASDVWPVRLSSDSTDRAANSSADHVDGEGDSNRDDCDPGANLRTVIPAGVAMPVARPSERGDASPRAVTPTAPPGHSSAPTPQQPVPPPTQSPALQAAVISQLGELIAKAARASGAESSSATGAATGDPVAPGAPTDLRDSAAPPRPSAAPTVPVRSAGDGSTATGSTGVELRQLVTVAADESEGHSGSDAGNDSGSGSGAAHRPLLVAAVVSGAGAPARGPVADASVATAATRQIPPDVSRPAADPRQATVHFTTADGAESRIRVRLVGDSLHATILTDSRSAAALAQALPELRRSLGDRGFSDAQVAVRVVGDTSGLVPRPETAAADAGRQRGGSTGTDQQPRDFAGQDRPRRHHHSGEEAQP